MKMKKIGAALIAALLTAACLSASGCSILDPGTTSDELVNIEIAADPVSIEVLQPELDEIARQYDEDGYMVGAVVTYDGSEAIESQLGILNVTYFSKTDENQEATVLTYDMNTRQVTEISYKSRYSIDVSQEPINEICVRATFASIFEMIYSDSSFSGKLSGTNVTLTITFDDEAITPSLI